MNDSPGEPAGAVGETGLDDDLVQPFLVERSQLRGRLIRLGSVLDRILTRHPYPPPAAALLGETLVLAVTLASGLKFDGIFTLQASGDGPIPLLVTDVAVVGGRTPPQRDVRGFAQVDAARFQALTDQTAAGDRPPTADRLLGKGLLAFTVDQGEHTDRYQGIVELSGDTITASVLRYFRQSEQLDTGIKVAVGRDAAGFWRGGAVMLQRLPDNEPIPGSDEVDDWRRAMLLLGTCSDHELLDPALPVHDLLYRLFHEEGVRVYPQGPVAVGCRCTVERIADVLRSLPRQDLVEVQDNGRVELTCDFCNKTFRFDQSALDAMHR